METSRRIHGATRHYLLDGKPDCEKNKAGQASREGRQTVKSDGKHQRTIPVQHGIGVLQERKDDVEHDRDERRPPVRERRDDPPEQDGLQDVDVPPEEHQPEADQGEDLEDEALGGPEVREQEFDAAEEGQDREALGIGRAVRR